MTSSPRRVRHHSTSVNGGSASQSRHVVKTSGSASPAWTNSAFADQNTTATQIASIARCPTACVWGSRRADHQTGAFSAACACGRSACGPRRSCSSSRSAPAAFTISSASSSNAATSSPEGIGSSGGACACRATRRPTRRRASCARSPGTDPGTSTALRARDRCCTSGRRRPIGRSGSRSACSPCAWPRPIVAKTRPDARSGWVAMVGPAPQVGRGDVGLGVLAVGKDDRRVGSGQRERVAVEGDLGLGAEERRHPLVLPLQLGWAPDQRAAELTDVELAVGHVEVAEVRINWPPPSTCPPRESRASASCPRRARDPSPRSTRRWFRRARQPSSPTSGTVIIVVTATAGEDREGQRGPKP